MQRLTVVTLIGLTQGELNELERRTRISLLVSTEARDRPIIDVLQARMRMIRVEQRRRGAQLRLW